MIEEEEVPDTFRALDSEGHPTGPTLGEIRKGVSGQQVNMKQLKRVNPELHAKLLKDFGNQEYVPAEILSPE